MAKKKVQKKAPTPAPPAPAEESSESAPEELDEEMEEEEESGDEGSDDAAGAVDATDAGESEEEESGDEVSGEEGGEEEGEEGEKSEEKEKEKESWTSFGNRHLDRRITKALAKQFSTPTPVQASAIPLILEGKDCLIKAPTGSGKTVTYLVPLLNKLLGAAEAGEEQPAAGKKELLAVVLVPTKDLVLQVHGVLQSLLESYLFDALSSDMVVSGAQYNRAELPQILVGTPSSVTALLAQRKKKLANLRFLAVDEADLMYTYGYKESMENLKNFLPASYQAVLCSATLSEEVQELKGLILHKPVTLKLSNEAAEGEEFKAGNLTQFYLPLVEKDKFLILYALLKLKLVSGKTLLFVKDIDSAYQVKLFLEKFSINASVLNSELSVKSRLNVIQSFNQNLVDIVIATDEGFEHQEEAGAAVEEVGSDDEDDGMGSDAEGLEDEEEEGSDEEEASGDEAEEASGDEQPKAKKAKKANKAADFGESFGEELPGGGDDSEDEEDEEEKEGAEKSDEDSEDMPEGMEGESPTKEGGEASDSDAEGGDEYENEKAVKGFAKKIQALTQKDRKRAKKMAAQQFSLIRGLDFKDVGTVLNVDMPASIRSYVHRIGRTARGGKDGTALSLVDKTDQKQIQMLSKISEHLAENEDSDEENDEDDMKNQLQQLPLRVQDIAQLRYRVEDVFRSVTRKAVRGLRAKELQQEALNSQKLQAYFEDHPEDLEALQRAQRELKNRKYVQKHLSHLPGYLLGQSSAADDGRNSVKELTGSYKVNPVKQAVAQVCPIATNRRPKRGRMELDTELIDGGDDPDAKRLRLDHQKKATRKGRKIITREMMARVARGEDEFKDPETLAPLSGRKLWKMNHGKKLKKVQKEQRQAGRSKKGVAKRKKRFNMG